MAQRAQRGEWKQEFRDAAEAAGLSTIPEIAAALGASVHAVTMWDPPHGRMPSRRARDAMRAASPQLARLADLADGMEAGLPPGHLAEVRGRLARLEDDVRALREKLAAIEELNRGGFARLEERAETVLELVEGTQRALTALQQVRGVDRPPAVGGHS